MTWTFPELKEGHDSVSIRSTICSKQDKKKYLPGHIVVKLQNIKDIVLKIRQKRWTIYTRSSIRLKWLPKITTMEAKSQWNSIFKVLREMGGKEGEGERDWDWFARFGQGEWHGQNLRDRNGQDCFEGEFFGIKWSRASYTRVKSVIVHGSGHWP